MHVNPPAIPPQPPSYQTMADANHLRTLSICYYVYGGITILFSLFALIYVAIGGALMSGAIPSSGSSSTKGAIDHSEKWIGGLFFGVGLIVFILILTFAVFCFLTARWLTERKYPVICMVVAGICCMNVPLGTILGVFTFIVLMRPSVQALFRDGPGLNNFTHH